MSSTAEYFFKHYGKSKVRSGLILPPQNKASAYARRGALLTQQVRSSQTPTSVNSFLFMGFLKTIWGGIKKAGQWLWSGAKKVVPFARKMVHKIRQYSKFIPLVGAAFGPSGAEIGATAQKYIDKYAPIADKYLGYAENLINPFDTNSYPRLYGSGRSYGLKKFWDNPV